MNISFMTNIQALAFHVRHNETSTSDHDYNTILTWTYLFIEDFYKRLDKNGKKWTLNRYKSIYSWTKNFIFNPNNKDNSKLDPFIQTTKQGVPKEISMISHLIYGGSPWIRVIMTVLRLFESIKLEVLFDPSSIISEYNGKPLDSICSDFYLFCQLWLNKYGKRIRDIMDLSKLRSTEMSFRLKSGPMGPSILTSHLDALSLRKDQTYHYFAAYCVKTASSGIMRLFGLCLNIIESDDNQNLIMGKISLANEPAGKTRLFAICNFWIQTVLKPLHDQLMLTLKLFRSDGTYDQVAQFNRLRKLSYGKTVYCFDLSKATDRFPIQLQEVLLSVLVDKEFAMLWKKLMIEPQFWYKDNPYTWKVGHPLGAFSSWAMFALTHHFVVQYCYYKAYNKVAYFNKYSLLGDDIGIWDPKVANKYQQFMSDIGVKINLSKSIVGNNSGEFANRLFYQGMNISGFGYNMLKQANASINGWIRYLEILESEGFITIGRLILLPGNNGLGLPNRIISQLTWLWTLRSTLAHSTILVYGNICLSKSDLIKYIVDERLILLNNQVNSSLKYTEHQFNKVKKRIQDISKCQGVVVKADYLDVKFINDELISHPIVRYQNGRLELLFDKIESFSEIVHKGYFDSSYILELSSYTELEYIPSTKLDNFYTDTNLNELKSTIKNSVHSRSFDKLMKFMKDAEIGGEYSWPQ